jgi:hypothetical protein
MTTTILTPVKDVRYDAETRDFCATVNGEIVGWAPTKIQAQVIANEYVFNLLSRDNVTAGELDITPEEAEDLLAAQQAVAADVAKAAEQTALEELERMAGVEETRRPARPADYPVYAPGGIDYEIGGIGFTLSADGQLITDPHRRDESFTTMRAGDVYALYIFLTKIPGVAAQIERVEAQRQQAFFERMQQDQIEDDARAVFYEGRTAGRREALELLKARLGAA